MSNNNEAQAPANASNTNGVKTVSFTTHQVESIKTVAVDQFPKIEIGHEIYASRPKRLRNWKAFFDALAVGGVFYVNGGPKEAQNYYMNGYLRNIKLSRKMQSGGSIRMQRIS